MLYKRRPALEEENDDRKEEEFPVAEQPERLYTKGLA
jgi:hypothetical protein